MQFFVATFMALNKEKGPLPSFKPAKFGGGPQKKLRKAKPEGEQLFLFDDKLRSEAPMFKLTKPSILADHLLPGSYYFHFLKIPTFQLLHRVCVVVRRLKHRGIWGRKRKRENKGYLPNMKTSKRMSMALYIVCQLLPIRNDPVHHAEKYPTPPAVYSGKHGSVSILNMYSSTLPPLTRYLHLLDKQFEVEIAPQNITQTIPSPSFTAVTPFCTSKKAKPEGEQLFLFDQATTDKLRSEAPMFKLTKPSILADRLLPVVVRRLKHRGIWGRKRKRENKGYLLNMKTSKRRNDPVHHAEKYPTPPAVYSGNIVVTPFCTSKYLSFISMFHVGGLSVND
ncbi:hypothetical protein F2Q70_00027024 [Brassica cretica]|uniref:Uncharacterized protein n=1 Tax=Brassica cretica TaxID=69181 RepID=A0A8S9L2T4_BRACR|nr:hypothetical protein F2Q70_00027024 [Brassica cretica]